MSVPNAREIVSDRGCPVEHKLRVALAEVCPVECWSDAGGLSPQRMIEADFAAAAVANPGQGPEQSEHGPGQSVRLWTNQRCIVATRAQSLMPNFAVAQHVSQETGWEIAVRRSGGSAVVHRPGILNVSWRQTMPASSQTWMTSGYQAFLEFLVRAMNRLGLQCDHGPVPGSYCDGRFNLRYRGRKLAGTAAHSGTAAGKRHCVFHASITVTGSIDEDLTAIQRFERCLGLRNVYDPSAHVSVSELYG